MSTKNKAKSKQTPDPTATGADEILSALEEGREPPHQSSIMDLADQAALTGIVDSPAVRDEIPGEDGVLGIGDPDVDALDNEFSGEEAPGATTSTPDQNNVDDIGRAYGMMEEDNGSLISAEEVVNRRDSHRWELDPRSKDPEA